MRFAFDRRLPDVLVCILDTASQMVLGTVGMVWPSIRDHLRADYGRLSNNRIVRVHVGRVLAEVVVRNVSC